MRKPLREEVSRLIEYPLAEGWKVIAGRTDAGNERVTFEIARPGDWWFHVHGAPGSHVVLQGPAGQEPARTVMKQAAAVAAYHSKARGAGVVPVSCTRARYVSKPRGAPPGTVAIRKETLLKVRPSEPEASAGGAKPGDAGTGRRRQG
jgi:predicted ribosome quality control (RQC) complex YloA/Tae2 family protein